MYHYYVVISGDKFNPSELDFLSDYNVVDSKDSGWTNRVGKIMKHGYLRIDGDGISELSIIAEKVTNATQNANEIQFWLARYYKNQCNLEFDNNELEAMSKLNATLCISCYQDDEIED